MLFQDPELGNADLELRLPRPVSTLTLDLVPGHRLALVAGNHNQPALFRQQVPNSGRLRFSTPIDRLKLAGQGFLFGVRLGFRKKGFATLSTVLTPVPLVHTAPLPPPEKVMAENLQRRRRVPPLVGFGSGEETLPKEPRHELGFRVKWRPTVRRSLEIWPAAESTAPPLDATFFEVEHRRWRAVQSGPLAADSRRRKLADRQSSHGSPARDRGHPRAHHRGSSPRPGTDLMQLYPEGQSDAPPGSAHLEWDDVFDLGEAPQRPVPRPGTRHQYRIRTVDVLGRGSDTWTVSEPQRLEKWLPPPVPVGPEERQPTAEDPRPVGAQAGCWWRMSQTWTPRTSSAWAPVAA